MHSKILSQWLANRNVIGHAVRAAALVRVVRALLSGGKLSLTHLGRCLGGSAYVKHQIKAVDRLLSNQHLHDERTGIYRAIAQTLLAGNKQPIILVDWCDFELGREWLMLKAALPVSGRALTLYERVFAFKRYNIPAHIGSFCRRSLRSYPINAAPASLAMPDFAGRGFAQSKRSAGIGSVEYAIRSSTTARRRAVGALPIRCTPPQRPRRDMSVKSPYRSDIAIDFTCTSYAPTSPVGVGLHVVDPSTITRQCTAGSIVPPGYWPPRYRTNRVVNEKSNKSTA